MIDRFSVELTSTDISNMKNLNGYQMYGCLAALFKEETADRLHNNIRSPISQNIIFNDKKIIWEINSFDELLSEEITDILHENTVFHAQKANTFLSVESVEHERIKNFSDIRKKTSALIGHKYIDMNFRTTTALKKNGEFLIFPDMELILKNLWNNWNMIFPDTPFDDEDAFRLLVKGVYISSYRLNSSIYRMKGNDIRGFYGILTVAHRLSQPMQEIFTALLVLSQYSGTGVKTTLGMGKTNISISN